MSTTTVLQEKISQLYVSLFGRAPEKSGLDYWVSEIELGRTWQQVAQSMYDVEPSREMYPLGLTNEGVIQRFYTGVFGRNPDEEGLKYWASQLETKSRGEVICELITAAVNYRGTDPAGLSSRSLLFNKVDVAMSFAVENKGENIAFSKTLLAAVQSGANGKESAMRLIEQHFDKTSLIPVVKLKSDTGLSNDDKISSNPALDVTGVSAGAVISYSVDGGGIWSDRFQPQTDGKKDLIVRVFEPTIQKTTLVPFSFTLDRVAPNAPSVSLNKDTGVVSNDKITRNAELNVIASDSSAIEYSIDGGNTWNKSLVPTEGHNTIFVRAADKAGNYSNASKFEFHLDTKIATPIVRLQLDTGVSGTDKVTQDPTIVVLDAEANADIAYSWDGGRSWVSSFVPGVDGSKTLMVRVTDLAGNQAASSELTFLLDRAAPAKPLVRLLSDTGSSDSDKFTSNGNLDLTLEQGTIVQYSSDGRNSWSDTFTPVSGMNTVFVRSTDKAGNTSISDLFEFILDTIAYTPIVSLSSDTGISSTDKVTNIGTLKVVGLDTGASLSYSVDGGKVFTGGFTPVQGINSVIVRSTDSVGNVALSSAFSFTLDSIAPTTATVSLATDSGSSSSDKLTKTAALNLNTEAGTTTAYSFDSGVNWSETYVPGGDGVKSLLVRSTDQAGNSSVSSPFSFTLDTATSTPIVGLSTDTGKSNSDRITSQASFNITNLEAGTTLSYSTDGGNSFTNSFTAIQGANSVIVRSTDGAGNTAQSSIFTFTLDSIAPTTASVSLATDSGSSSSDKLTKTAALDLIAEIDTTTSYSFDGGANWSESYTPGADGAKSLLIRSTDQAGNSSVSSPFSFTLDTVTSTPIVVLSTDTGKSNSDRITSQASLNITNLEAGATLTYSINGGNSFSNSFTAIQGANSVIVRSTDSAGNTAQSSVFTFTLDSLAPTTPTVSLATDSGTSSSDKLTKTAALNVNTETGTTTSYSFDGGVNWSETYVPGADGAKSVLVRSTDIAGNSKVSSPFSFTLDTSTSVPMVALSTDTGKSNNDRITSQAGLNITNLEDGATLTYSINGGNSFSNSFTAVQGANSVIVRSTDSAGNTAQSSSFTFTFDSLAPTTPTVSLATDSGTSSSDKLTKTAALNVNTETGSTTSYSFDGGVNWSETYVPGADGVKSVLVRSTDSAGNTAQAAAFSYTLDTIAPSLSAASITYGDNGDRNLLNDTWTIGFSENITIADSTKISLFNATRGTYGVFTASVISGNQLRLTSSSSQASNWTHGDLIDIALTAGAITDLAGNANLAVPITGNLTPVLLNGPNPTFTAGSSWTSINGYHETFTGTIAGLSGTTITGNSADTDVVTLTTAGTVTFNSGFTGGTISNVKTLNLANGTNSITYANNAGLSTINGGTGNDDLWLGLASSGLTINGGEGDDRVFATTGFVNGGSFNGGDGMDAFVFSSDVTLPATSGSFKGGNGTDFLQVIQNGSIVLADSFFQNASELEVLSATTSSGSVSITFGSNARAAFSSLNYTNILATGTSLFLDAGSFTTELWVNGTTGNDTMTSGSGRDWLMGGDGNDTLNSGTGNDWLQGGTGNDTYVFGANDARAWIKASVYQDNGTVGTIDNGDIINFGYREVDEVTWGSGDQLDLVSGLTFQSYVNGSNKFNAASNEVIAIRGSWLLGTFSVNSAGADSVLIFNNGTEQAIVVIGNSTVTGADII